MLIVAVDENDLLEDDDASEAESGLNRQHEAHSGHSLSSFRPLNWYNKAFYLEHF